MLIYNYNQNYFLTLICKKMATNPSRCSWQWILFTFSFIISKTFFNCNKIQSTTILFTV